MIKYFKMKWRKLACGHRVIYNGDIQNYLNKVIEHVQKCEIAQEIMIENYKGVK